VEEVKKYRRRGRAWAKHAPSFNLCPILSCTSKTSKKYSMTNKRVKNKPRRVRKRATSALRDEPKFKNAKSMG
jgi:hypothetical protein